LSKENEALVGQIKDLTERLTDCETRLPQKITPITQAKRNEISETIKNKLEAGLLQLLCENGIIEDTDVGGELCGWTLTNFSIYRM
jgi:hypothetical protein